MERRRSCPSEALLTATTALSIALSQGRTAAELDTLALFFTVLGDSLALLALQTPNEQPELP